jgi:DNA-binding LacI/PurR family transcriptional regulator
MTGLRLKRGRAEPEVIADPEDVDLLARAREVLAKPNRPTGILALWREHAEVVLSAARELRLKLGRDFDLVGWCAEELYESAVVKTFRADERPPVIAWDVSTMARAATTRLAERHANPALPPMRMNIETRLKLPEKPEAGNH